MDYWKPGDPKVLRSMWGARVRAAWPVTVITDQPEYTATYLRKGTIFQQARTHAGQRVRLPVGEWRLAEEVWTRDTVRLAFPGKSYSVLAIWDDDGKGITNWYVNLEKPFERHGRGYDFEDLFLDVVISGNLREWRWKDEDELDEAVSAGLLSHKQAQDTRMVGEQVIALASTNGSPFSDGWEKWKPNPQWVLSSISLSDGK